MAEFHPNMASADDDSGIPLVPALPPIDGFDGQLPDDEFPTSFNGQSSPPGAAAGCKVAPPTHRINVMHSDEPTAISGLTTTNAGAASADNSKRSRAYSALSDDEYEPSPKKALPDFSIRKSDNDSVVSGDMSIGWNDINERVTDDFISQAIVADAHDAAVFPDICPMNEVNEWEMFADGNADDANAPPAAVQYETVRIHYLKTTTKILVDIAARLGISKTGTKRKLFDKLRNSERALKIDDDTFDYRREIVEGEVVPTWIILTPQPAPAVPGIDMATGAQTGFFGPTNKENAVGGVRQNFLTLDGERIERPTFEARTKARTTARKNATTNESGGPSPVARKKIPSMKLARPKDSFDLQITPEFVKWVTLASNKRAAADGAGCGTGEFKDFVAFDEAEIYKFFGTLFANGLAPKARIDYWFESVTKFPLFGNDLTSRTMAKEVFTTGTKIRGVRRWRHLRRFFTLADYRDNPWEMQKLDALWKVRQLIDELNKQAKDMWIPGKCVAIDEQTIGFQGALSMKLRISYKREGDGFQCDALCDRGYTYSFWFRHGPPPTLGPEFKDLELSPTACRVIWLAQRLSNKWTRIYMDNLFNSVKLFEGLYRAKALAHGVVRTNGRGLPLAIIQKEEKNKDLAEKLRGTTKAAQFKHNPQCPNVLAASTYDTKPVHLLSTVAE